MTGQYVKIEKRIKANTQMAHLVLPNTQADPSQNPKSHFNLNKTYKKID